MRTALAGFSLLIAAAGMTVAQDMPQRGEMAFGRQPLVRGTVTATAADHLTIKTDAGETYSVAVSANTRLMRQNGGMMGGGMGGSRGPRPDGQAPGSGPATSGGGQAGGRGSDGQQTLRLQDVKVGDVVGAMGEVDSPNKTVHALFVGVMDAEQAKKLREGLGKEYITGKITVMDEVKLTILRPDNVSQVIEVDETTSFRKGGRRRQFQGEGTAASPGAGGTASSAGSESVTLADIKVGDMVAGQGALKHGVFVPTTLTVMTPGAMGPRMRPQDGSAAAKPTPQQ